MADEAVPARPGAGEDQALRAAASRIMQLPPDALGLAPQEEIERPAREDIDPTERQHSSDLAMEERAQKEREQTEAGETETDGETEEAGATEGAASDFIEIPVEGGEAERVPLAEAVEAIKQARELKGDIAAAINKAEAAYQTEQDAILGEMVKIHTAVYDRADAALRMIPRPQRPSELYLDSQSDYYNPPEYARLQLQYERQVELLQHVQKERDQAKKNADLTMSAAEQAREAREHDRLGRVKGWEDWKDPGKRSAKQAELTGNLEKLYGIPPDMLSKYPFDHRIMQMVSDAIAHKSAPAKAIEVKQAVQAKAAKVVKGQATPARTADGRFVNEAMKELGETGSRESAAKAILRMGLAKRA